MDRWGWLFGLDAAGLIAAGAAVLLPWQVTSGRYPGGSFVFSYYVFGTQCAAFGTSSDCTTTDHLTAGLTLVAVLAFATLVLALGVAAVSRAARRSSEGPGLRRRAARWSSGTTGVVAMSAAIAYATYTYRHGAGLWTVPSAPGFGWYLEWVAGSLLLAGALVAAFGRPTTVSDVGSTFPVRR